MRLGIIPTLYILYHIEQLHKSNELTRADIEITDTLELIIDGFLGDMVYLSAGFSVYLISHIAII